MDAYELKISVGNPGNTGIDDFIALSESNEMLKRDHTPVVRDVRFIEGITTIVDSDHNHIDVPVGKVSIPDAEIQSLFGGSVNTDSVLDISDHAIDQLAQRLGQDFFDGANKSLPRDFLRHTRVHYPHLFCDTLNEAISSYNRTGRKSETWFAREFNGTLRAVLSDRYAAVDSSEVLQALKAISEDQGLNLTFTNSYLTPNEMALRVLTPNVWEFTDGGTGSGDVPVRIGAYVSTDEIGKGQLKVLPMVQNTNCLNSAKVTGTDNGFVQRHVGDKIALAVLMLGALGGVFRASGELMKRLMESRYKKLPRLDTILDGIVDEFQLGDGVKQTMLVGTEGKRDTVFDLWQGVTYAATRTPDVTNDTTELLESFAGNMLMVNDPVRYLTNIGTRYEHKVKASMLS